MPKSAELRRRGGAVRVRTMTLPNGEKRRVYVVKKAGPRGGHTIVAPEQIDRPRVGRIKKPKER